MSAVKVPQSSDAATPMFKLVRERRAWWPVGFVLPTEEGCGAQEVTVQFKFRVVGIDEARELTKQAGALDDRADERSASVRFADFTRKIADDWRGVGGDNGEPLPWTPDNLARLLDMQGVFPAVMEAYRDCLAGRIEAREKN